MSILLSSITGRVEVAPDPAMGDRRIDGIVRVAQGPTDIDGSVTVDGTVQEAAKPAPGEIQIVGVEVVVDGEVLDPRWIESWSVERTMDGATATLTLFTLAELGPLAGRDPVGSPFAYLGPPPGKAPISIYGIYHTTTGRHSIPLLVNGIVDNASRVANAQGFRDVLNIADPLARYDRQVVTLALPPGHGLDRSEVVRRLLSSAGVAAFNLTPSGRMDKAVTAIDQEPFGLARELQDTSNRALLFDRTGDLYNPDLIPDSSESVQFTFEDRDFLMETGISVQTIADVPTKVTITGTEQVTQDECGIRTEQTVVESFAPYSPLTAPLKQENTGVLNPTGATPPQETLTLTSRVTTIRTFDCDTLITEQVITEAYYNPIAARYQWNAGGTVRDGYISPVFLYEGAAVKDDENQAYQWVSERFVKVSDIFTTHVYDPDTNFEIQTIVDTRGYYQRRAALKSRTAPSITFESQDYVGFLKVLASGEGVLDTFEVFWSPTTAPASGEDSSFRERTTISFDVDLSGFVKTETAVTESFLHLGGELKLYFNAEQSSQGTDLMQVSLTVATVNTATGEGSHSTQTTRTPANGRVEIQTTEEAGFLPASNFKDDPLPDPVEFPDGRVASLSESKQIKSICEAPFLLATKEAYEIKVSSPWVENEQEAEALCLRTLRQGAADAIVIELPANFLLHEAMLTRATLLKAGLNHEVWLTVVRWAQSAPDQPILTAAEGRIFWF